MKKNIFSGNAKIFVALCVVSFGLLAVAGCAVTSNNASGSNSAFAQQGSPSARILRFDDVPVPGGFKLIENESFTFQNDQMRVGLLKYGGMPDAGKVVEFYKEQMPAYNWDLINVIEYGQRIMNFERPDQSCIITIQPMSTRTLIAIAIAPKSSGAMTQEKTQRYKELKSDRLGVK